MSPDLASWLGQIPWVPLAIVAVLAVLWILSHRGAKKKRRALATKLAEGAKVIDVRTKGEFAGGHFPGAVNIPLDSLGSKLKTLGASETAIVVYCASGIRSAQAASSLRAAGFTDVTNAGSLGSLPRD